MRLVKTGASLAAVAIVAVVLGVAVLSRLPADQSLPPLAPGQPVEQIDDDCQGAYELVDRIPEPIEMAAKSSSAVFIGTVSEVGPAQWNTKDGKPPTSDEGVTPFDVVRLVRVEVNDRLTGDSTMTQATVWIRGGQIGCSLYTYSDYPDEITKGDEFAFFLDGALPEFDIAGVQRARLMWALDESGAIISQFDGSLSHADFVEAVAPK